MTREFGERIHPTAVVDPEAVIADDVLIGPYSIVEGPVTIGPACVIEGHVCLTGPLTLGAGNVVGHGSVLGKRPQTRSLNTTETSLEIGNSNVFREYVTVHRGSLEGGGLTAIGDNNLLMIGAHVGHDVQMGNNCTLVNNCLVAGHVELGDGCILSGHAVVQQKVRIGRLAMMGGLAGTSKDIPPFVLQQGYNCVTGLNLIGMRRSGLRAEAVDAIRSSFRILYREGRNQQAALHRIDTDYGEIPEIREFTRFIRDSKLGINQAREIDRHQWLAETA